MLCPEGSALRPEQTLLRVDGRDYPAWIEDGYVCVRLPFAVDLTRLSRLLREHGLFIAHPTDEEIGRIGDQGWGAHWDPQDYYPFYVEPEGDGSRFTFPPADYHRAPDGTALPRVGDGARQILQRWLPLLEQARADG